jgi:PAS domain-containing protein
VDKVPTPVSSAEAASRVVTSGIGDSFAGAREVQLRRFDVALNNLTQGVCFFDGAHRLILANRRYAEIYNLPVDCIRPGISLGEIVDLRYAAGTFPAMTRGEYLAWRAAIAVSDQSSNTVVELTSGQVISIHHRPMPDGGWVSTHEDITERRQAERRLAHGTPRLTGAAKSRRIPGIREPGTRPARA